MNTIQNYWSTTAGKKQWVGLTGLAVAAFTLVHMSGNLLLFVGPEAYNRYSHTLTSTPLIYIAEVGLVLFFLVHIYLALSLAVQNRKAKPIFNSQKPHGVKNGDFASKSMIYTGLLMLVFTVLHLITFKYGTYYTATYGGVEMRDLYRLVDEKFHEPLYVAWYLFAMVVLGVHLSHGISGAAQSLGFLSVRTPWLKKFSFIFALVVAGGFFSQPFVLFLKR